ncbi:hypothetical protein PAECIP111891_01439 [Paenibacillus allorhizoplanae]|uniref:Uncharacterized protein n=1 Tax=Paenibacillus allorhizoplanae TaxID=2905648 RepID=A0ABM9C1X9_9BACL|nr:hypothetical protein PAECIP111891_01439 [Paenibacillus allorhizoplanae]
MISLSKKNSPTARIKLDLASYGKRLAPLLFFITLRC